VLSKFTKVLTDRCHARTLNCLTIWTRTSRRTTWGPDINNCSREVRTWQILSCVNFCPVVVNGPDDDDSQVYTPQRWNTCDYLRIRIDDWIRYLPGQMSVSATSSSWKYCTYLVVRQVRISEFELPIVSRCCYNDYICIDHLLDNSIEIDIRVIF
jgi:NAD-dependent dihydropyrimidine dehydrogenase PreA subunit